MENKNRREISLKNIRLNDMFWNQKEELIRKEVLPYQWNLLNDRVPEAAPSFCMRNFKIAAKINHLKKNRPASWTEPVYTDQGFEVFPDDMEHLEDRFYGFVFQDSDFYKWIEAAAYTLENHPDPRLEEIADKAIEVVCAAQQDNGYLDTYYIIGGMDKIFTNLKDHHELYCMGHLIEGAAAYYEATGKDWLLQAAVRFADYVDSVFGPEDGKCKGYPGHELAEMALIRLYQITGAEKYLKLALFFINERGRQPWYWQTEPGYKKGDEERYSYNQSHLPVRRQQEATGHAVRAMYLYCGMTDAARLTGDTELWNVCRQLWSSTVHQKMYITGGIGATSIGEAFSFPYDLPNDLAYAETCASVGLVFWAWRMLLNETRSEYADVMELALYNTVLSGMAQDGKSFFYVNPLEVFPRACHEDARKSHVKTVRQKWFGCACCPPNLARTVASIGKYAFTENDSTFWIHLYIGAEVQAGGHAVRITSGFPWDGHAEIEVLEDMENEYSFALRIPGWCEDYELIRSGFARKESHSGYLYLTKKWKSGDRISINFPMQPTAIIANPQVREDIGKAAVMRGPVVYCLEEADNGNNLHLTELKLPLSAEAEQSGSVPGNAVCINARGRRRKPDSSGRLYKKYDAENFEDTVLHYIPYFLWNNRGEGEMQVWTDYTPAD